jgi:hypothetical protein
VGGRVPDVDEVVMNMIASFEMSKWIRIGYSGKLGAAIAPVVRTDDCSSVSELTLSAERRTCSRA